MRLPNTKSLCAGALLALMVPVRAQVGSAAELYGTLTDPSGASVPKQTFEVRNLDTGHARKVATSGSGFYTVSSLPPGPYELTVDAPGFAPFKTSNLVLAVGQQARLDIQLRLAPGQEAIEVSAAHALDPARTDLSEVIEERRIENLPIN